MNVGSASIAKRGFLILVLVPWERIGFARSDGRVIEEAPRKAAMIRVFESLRQTFPAAQIILKPHPMYIDFSSGSLSDILLKLGLDVANPSEAVECYIPQADMVIELPRAASSATFRAVLQIPEKPILVLDFFEELIGDCFKDRPEVTYIPSFELFIETLYSVRDGTFTKPPSKTAQQKGSFRDSEAILRYYLRIP